MTASVTFYGGVGLVTGANFLVTTDKQKILIDCGLFQDKDFCSALNFEPFPYDPSSIDVLIVTHAHIDHIGRIPRLVRAGFRGKIYSTPATRDIAALMFDDALSIMRDVHTPHCAEPLYEPEDVQQALSIWETVDYYTPYTPTEGVTVRFLDAGHILGSAMVECERGGQKILFSGDLGNSPSPLLRDTDSPRGARYLVMESVYGDRNHEARSDRRMFLGDIINEAERTRGLLLIPAFSVERTQVLLHEIHELMSTGEIRPVPVYLDAPLAIRVSSVYRNYPSYFNEHIQAQLKKGIDPFNFEGLKLTPNVLDSQRAAKAPNPKIIIAGSGMSYGGRILSHEKTFLGDKSTYILFAGYQAPGSVGRRIQEGNKKVLIDGQWVRVRAQIRTVTGYSAHKDRDSLIQFVEEARETLREVFVVMGEPRSTLFLSQRINDFLGVRARAPYAGDTHTIDW